MLSIHGSAQRLCDGVSRREVLKLGALGIGGLALPDLLRARAQASTRSSQKAIIMVYLNGGPSHMDMYDMKPAAPAEYRGEFRPVRTNVPGMDICELFPMQAQIADKFAIVRNMRFQQMGHTSPELYTGFLSSNRPSIGSVVSKLRRDGGVIDAMPPYIALGDANHVGSPGFLGKAHEPYVPGNERRVDNLGLAQGLTLPRLAERRSLLHSFDGLRRDLDHRGTFHAVDAFTAQALEMVTSNRARDAFDISKEPLRVRERYGYGREYLQARRLVEAGVPVVTLTPQNHALPTPRCNGQWDHHEHIFECLRIVLPQLDRSLSALITDLHERGMADDVGVVVWGEMGRTPRIGTQQGTIGGRDHWPQSGFALLACGGLRTGQVIGATDPRGETPRGQPYTPQNILATLYHVLGIDPITTLPDHQGRPIYLLDDRRPVAELV